jgi:hypothetical protein
VAAGFEGLCRWPSPLILRDWVTGVLPKRGASVAYSQVIVDLAAALDRTEPSDHQ